MSKKVVLKLEVHNEKEKQKAMKSVSTISGLVSIAMDMKEKKLTVVGDVDPVEIVSKLRKCWHTEVLTVGPAKKEEKINENVCSNPYPSLCYNPYPSQPYSVYAVQENPPNSWFTSWL